MSQLLFYPCALAILVYIWIVGNPPWDRAKAIRHLKALGRHLGRYALLGLVPFSFISAALLTLPHFPLLDAMRAAGTLTIILLLLHAKKEFETYEATPKKNTVTHLARHRGANRPAIDRHRWN